MRVLVVGAGYVGLATAVVFAQKHDVTVVEENPKRVDKLRLGKIPFYEQDLQAFLNDSIAAQRFRAVTTDYEPMACDIVVVCVGTPPRNDGSVNLDNLSSAINDIKQNLNSLLDGYLTVVVRSTVPPGTTRELVQRTFRNEYENGSVGIVFNPEFMRQGHAIADIQSPHRLIIGASDGKAAETYLILYRSVLANKNTPILQMSLESAELVKYASNCFLATKVSFANEIATIAEKIPEANIDDVMKGVVADSRINPSHLRAGLGFGGTCLPKDLSGLISCGAAHDLPMDLLRAVDAVNRTASRRLMAILNGNIMSLEGEKIAVLGLTFKSGTDDTRASQSISLIRELLAARAKVAVHDPMANEGTIDSDIRGFYTRYDDVLACVQDASAVFLMTDWPIYKELGLEKIVAPLKKKLVIDGRRMFAGVEIPSDVEYRCLGSHKSSSVDYQEIKPAVK